MNRLRIVLVPSLMCLLMALACDRDNPENPVEDPVLKITSDDLDVGPSGQDCSVPYTLTGKVDGGTFSAMCPADWISEIDDTAEGTVSFIVLPNDTGAERISQLILSYMYGEGKEVKDSVIIRQAAVAEEEYDYVFKMTELSGVYYGTKYGVNGEYSYFTTLSDLPYGDDGYSQPGGTYYILDMFGPAPDGVGLMCPAGTYTIGEPGATAEYTFTPEISFAATISDDGEYRTMYVTFVDGSVSVSRNDGGDYVIDARLVDNEGKTHHVTYTGNEGDWKDDSAPDIPPYGVIDKDLNVAATTASAKFIAANGTKDMMTIVFNFTDMASDGDGNMISPGSVVTVEGFVPYDVNGYIAQGEYEILVGGREFILVPGKIEDFMGSPIPTGTCAEYIDEAGYPYYGGLTAGTMTVSGPGYGWYTIEWNMTTSEGHSVTGSWNGNLVTEMPKEFSTLEDDYTLDLSNVEANATYYGDWYVNGGGNWQISLYPPLGVEGGDGLIIDVNTERLGYDAGIPSGTYTAGADDYPQPAYPEVGEYRRGFLDKGKPSGTVYVGDLDGFRNPREMAPATGGDLTVLANDDGTYTLNFSFLDDRGNVWDGEWTGNITLSKYAFAGDAPMKNTPAYVVNPYIFRCPWYDAGISEFRIFRFRPNGRK